MPWTTSPDLIRGFRREDRLLRAPPSRVAPEPAPTERGGWRISKRKSQERIDAAVSLAMVAERAVTMRNVKPVRRTIHL